MQTTIKIVMLVIIMMARGEAKGDMKNIVKEMKEEMNAMNERLAMTERRKVDEDPQGAEPNPRGAIGTEE